MTEENTIEEFKGELQKQTWLCIRKNQWPRRQDILIYLLRGVKGKKNEKWWRKPTGLMGHNQKK